MYKGSCFRDVCADTVVVGGYLKGSIYWGVYIYIYIYYMYISIHIHSISLFRVKWKGYFQWIMYFLERASLTGHFGSSGDCPKSSISFSQFFWVFPFFPTFSISFPQFFPIALWTPRPPPRPAPCPSYPGPWRRDGQPIPRPYSRPLRRRGWHIYWYDFHAQRRYLNDVSYEELWSQLKSYVHRFHRCPN